MSLLRFCEVSFTWRHPLLLADLTFAVDSGERIGLVGRNGCGKSTLMKLMSGELQPDHGQITRAAGVSVSRLIQEVPHGDERSVAEIVSAAWRGEPGAEDAWKREPAVARVLSRVQLDGASNFSRLSSGLKRRTLLAQALVCDPDILLLDEPTNHLDLDSIAWLEGFLQAFRGTLVFVTHDRVFLQALATRIIEIDRGRMFDWTCDYATFLERKEAALEAEEKQEALFDRRLAQEEAWIRQGIKARRTRNEGRVKALNKMRQERRERRARLGSVRMEATGAEASGERVVEARDVGFAYGERPVVANFSTLVTRGDKIGIIGPNGAGKTTLLKLLLGELRPTSGTIRHGTRLDVTYFDQLREQIDDDKSVAENVGDGSESLLVGGRQRHVIGYLQDFLFTPDQSRQLARFLSGGERNRLLLARLLKRPSNVLVLDEPTNDLDLETLELLEELVVQYDGTVLLVSHDRAFLNNVVTSTLVMGDGGRVKEYDGGYDDYVRQRDAAAASETERTRPAARPAAVPPGSRPAPRERLSYREQRELEALPARIEAIEREQAELHAAMADPTFFKREGSAIAETRSQLDQLGRELAELYARWESLDARA